MRWASCMFGAAVVACYSPHTPTEVPCRPGIDSCPSGQTCAATVDGTFCLPEGLADGGVVDDSPPSTTDGGPNCFGTGTVHDVCFTQPPSGNLAISVARSINTASVGGDNCAAIIAQPGG